MLENIRNKLAIGFAAGLWFLSAWLVVGHEVVPFSPLFSLLLLYVSAIGLGWIVTIFKVPRLIGMLISGVVIVNVSPAQVPSTWSAIFRLLALALILLRGGLGMDTAALKATASTTLLLCFVPAVCETIAITILAYFLIGLPFLWSMMLGFGISAISPAVVVPILLNLQEAGYGVEKGIPTMILAASGLDDVLGVTGFTIIASIIFSTSQSLVMDILQAPIEIIAGILIGLIVGVTIATFNVKFKIEKEELFQICMSASAATILSAYRLRFQGAGALAVMVCGCVVANNSDVRDVEYLNTMAKKLWETVGEPLLFVLVGATVLLENIDSQSILFGILVICIALIPRSAGAFVSTMGAGFTMKERIFICISWLPKATVQAAMASIPLDLALQSSEPNFIEIRYSYQVLSVLVLSIFITAPVGAFLVQLFGTELLEKKSQISEVVVEI
jgi:solute carrier family 9B (sodium/hydrogen exchanger), member 1/2